MLKYSLAIVSRPLLTLLLLSFLASCSEPLALIGLGENAIEKGVPGATEHEIYFSTTRARSSDDRVYFGGGRSPVLTSGKIIVDVPPTHESGSVELPRDESGFDPERHFSVSEPLIYDGTKAFVNRLRSELSKRSPKHRNIMIFVHGYNTSFSAAVTRVTQFVHDTNFDGIPILFSWASRAKTTEYVYDINSALQARFHMAELALAMQDLDINEYSIVAHSMGNLATLETLVVLNTMPDFNPHGKLKAIILAAPDVDLDLFKEHIHALGRVREKIYVLISSDDKALGLSRFLAGGVSRAGAANPADLAKLGITVVDLSQIHDSSRIDHSKFADSPEIVQLIGNSINSGNTLSTHTDTSKVSTTVGGIFRQFSQIGGGNILTLGN